MRDSGTATMSKPSDVSTENSAMKPSPRLSRLNLPRPPGLSVNAIPDGGGSIIARTPSATTTTNTSASSTFTPRNRNTSTGSRFALPPGSDKKFRRTPVSTPHSSPNAKDRQSRSMDGMSTPVALTPQVRSDVSDRTSFYASEQSVAAASPMVRSTNPPASDQITAINSSEPSATMPSSSNNKTPQTSLPNGWVESVDSSSGRVYYFHTSSSKTQWERPTSLNETFTVESTELAPLSSTTSDKTEVSHTDRPQSPTTLPEGWVKLKDDQSNQFYYFHTTTGKTSWLIPNDENEQGSNNSKSTESMGNENLIPTLSDSTMKVPVSDSTVVNKDTPACNLNDTSSEIRTATMEEKIYDFPDGQRKDKVEYMHHTTEQDCPTVVTGHKDEGLKEIDQLIKPVDIAQVLLTTSIISQSTEESRTPDANDGHGYLQGTQSFSPPDSDKPTPESIDVITSDRDVVTTTVDNPIEPNITLNDQDDASIKSLLPHGWIELIDEGTGLPYYYCEKNGLSQWDRPTANVGMENILAINSEDIKNTVPELSEDSLEQAQNSSIDHLQGRGNDDTIIQSDHSISRRSVGDNVVQNILLMGNDKLVPKTSGHLSEHQVVSESFVIDQPSVHILHDTEEILHDLPPGWERILDESSGIPYYYCEAENRTQWEIPERSPQPIVNCTPNVSNDCREVRNNVQHIDDDGDDIKATEPVTGLSPSGEIVTSIDTDPIKSIETKTSGNTSSEQQNVSPDIGVEVERMEFTQKGENIANSLPAGWIEVIDPISGRPYYFCEYDNSSQWDRPLSHVNNESTDFCNSIESFETTTDVTRSQEVNILHLVAEEHADIFNLNSQTSTTLVDSPCLSKSYVEHNTEHKLITDLNSEFATSEDSDTFLDAADVDQDSNLKRIEDYTPHLQAVSENKDDNHVNINSTLETVPPLQSDILAAELPSGWIELVDDSTGKPFYFNEANGSSQWERPTPSINGPPYLLDGFDRAIESDDFVDAVETHPDSNILNVDERMLLSKETINPLDSSPTFTEDFRRINNSLTNGVSQVSVINETSHPEDNVNSDVSVDQFMDPQENNFAPTDEAHFGDLPPGSIEVFSDAPSQSHDIDERDGTTQWDCPRPNDLANEHFMKVDELEGFIDAVDEHPEAVSVVSLTGPNQVEIQAQEAPKEIAGEQYNTDISEVFETYDKHIDNHVSNVGQLVSSGSVVLPEGWTELFDEASGRPYFYCELNGMKQWDPPSFNSDSIQKNDTVLSDLPSGWSEIVDESTGNTYFYCSIDGSSQWERPSMDVLPNITGGDTITTDAATINVTEPDVICDEDTIDHPLQELETLDSANQSDHPPFKTDSIEKNDTVLSDLPSGWSEIVDESTGNTYFYCSIDGSSQWERPSADVLPHVKMDETFAALAPTVNVIEPDVDSDNTIDRPSQVIETNSVSAGFANETLEVDPASMSKLLTEDRIIHDSLPQGWSRLIDESSGEPYYYCEAKNLTTWEPPTEMYTQNDGDDGTCVMQRNHVGNMESIMESTLLSIERSDKDGTLNDVLFTEVDNDESNDYVAMVTDEPQKNVDPSYDCSVDFATGDVTSNRTTLEPVLDSLSDGWVELIDANSGQPYYYNNTTGATQWERPSVSTDTISYETNTQHKVDKGDMDSRIQSPGHDIATYSGNTKSEAIVDDTSGEWCHVGDIDKRDQEPLPPGWVELIDNQSQKPYYLNEIAGVTQWDRPYIEGSSDPCNKDMVSKIAHLKDDGETVNIVQQETLPKIDLGVIDPTQIEGLSLTSAVSVHVDDKATESTGVLDSVNVLDEAERIKFDMSHDVARQHEDLDITFKNNETQLNTGQEHSLDLLNDESAKKSNTTFDLHELPHETPLELDDNLMTQNSPKHESGRSFRAFAVFGFGGRLCTYRFHGAGKSTLVVNRVFDLVPSHTLVKMEKFKHECGLEGPLCMSDDKVVQSYIDRTNLRSPDLLWNLIQISSISRGRLRSDNGVAEDGSPESHVIKLLLRDKPVLPLKPKATCLGSKTPAKISSDEEQIIYLLMKGLREEAVEVALQDGNYALALLVGSMCSSEVFRFIGKEFANTSFGNGSPLATIALLFSGNLRADTARTFWESVSARNLTETWRAHLAAIISNRTNEWEYILIALGDRLVSIGEIIPAHFCYMVCGCPVSSPHRTESRLSLIGCYVKPLDTMLMSDESLLAFQRTEAYEWCKRRGNPHALISSLLSSKLMYAVLLADFGFDRLALEYSKHVLESLRSRVDEKHSFLGSGGSLAVHILASNRNGLIAFLEEFEKRLSHFHGGYDEASTSLCGTDDGADVSFVTALSSTHVTFQVPDRNINQLNNRTEIPETPDNFQSQLDQKKTSSIHSSTSMSKKHDNICNEENDQSFVVNDNSETKSSPINGSSASIVDNRTSLSSIVMENETFTTRNSSLDLQPADQPELLKNSKKSNENELKKPPSTLGNHVTSLKPSKKPPNAPVSAPANLERSTKRAPTSGGLLGLIPSFRDSVTKWLNPDATKADLGEGMQAYFDEDKKVWVFPGEDPAELAKPIGPPPITPTASSSVEIESTPTPVNDPLKAMMLPPVRIPSARRGRTAVPAPSTAVFGPPAIFQHPASSPQFAVFKPTKAVVAEEAKLNGNGDVLKNE